LQGTEPNKVPLDSFQATCDEQGHFTFAKVPAGTYSVTTRESGKNQQVGIVEARSGETSQVESKEN
jgi:hypothetical protein